MNKTPKGIFEEYEKGRSYKTSIDLYETVKRNEDFYLGRQWVGVNAPDLDKPVLNIVRRVATYQVAMVVSDDVGVSVSPINPSIPLDGELLNKAILHQIDQIREENSIPDINRLSVRNASVDGDACVHAFFDPSVKTPDPDVMGAIRVEVIENLNVFFGNPKVRDKEKQPFILLAARRLKESVQEEMKANKRPKEDIDAVVTGSESSPYRDESDNERVTVITKYYKENGTVWVTKVTEDLVVMEPVDTGLTLYPISYMSWEIVKDSYHGEAAMTNMIPNQIFINKLLAMAMKSVKDTAFPKVIYDSTKFTEGWSNRLGAVEVNGDPNQSTFVIRPGADMSPQVIQLVNMVTELTRDMMGASDAALGNVRPENTSAIIAVQQSTAVPLELFRREYYRFVEDYIRVFIDMMGAYYGLRTISTDELGSILFDFSSLQDLHLSLNITIGESTYWSELMQMQTLENLRMAGIIDPITYLEEMPAKYVRNKEKLTNSAKMMSGMMGGGGGDVSLLSAGNATGIGPGNPGGHLADLLMPGM